MDNEEDEMHVIKRNGAKEVIAFDKILRRVKKIGTEFHIQIPYSALVMKVIDQLYDNITTTQIDELTAEQCASMCVVHPDYGKLAGLISVSNMQKNTDSTFFSVMKKLYEFRDVNDVHNPLISEELWSITEKHATQIETMIDYDRDFMIDFFGYKTLERAYLMRIHKKIVERPQHMWMRVAIGIHGDDFERVRETYDLMSQKYMTHATPTLFNSGTPRPQLSSCYLLALEDDSVDGIYNTLKDCAKISKWAGGIGLHIHNLRASGSHIRGTNGTSNGLVPMLRVFNNTARYIDQCVIPETYIYTTQGPMHICDVHLHETCIFNSTGKEEVIKDVLEHTYDGNMLEIHTMHSLEPLKITPEHPVYVLENIPRGTNFSHIRNKLMKKYIVPNWVDAKDLTKDDIVLYKIPTYEKDVESITEDDCYMYGIILGDGYFNNKGGSGHITMHSEKKRHILEFCEHYFKNNLVHYSVYIEDNTTRIRWNKNNALPFRHSDIYDSSLVKHVHHKWLNLPLCKMQQIVRGLLDSDGCKGKELVFDNTSRNLIESMRYMCLRMGILTSGYIRDRLGEKHETSKGMIENKKISYCLRIPQTKEICTLLNIVHNEKGFEKFFKYEGLLGSRIQNIVQTEYQGTLYDLQMEKVHDYMLHHGIVHNGGGRRNGSFAIYLEPWHADIEDFLEMRKNHGDEEMKARDLFYALWIPDLFMERVKENGLWHYFCPDECPGLSDAYGDAFRTLYEKYVGEKKYRKEVNARDLWFRILDSQMETGTPYILYKDAANEKSNQKNLGTIKSSNLCTEIIEYSDSKQTAVCNLASIALNKMVNETTKEFDYEKLHEVAKVITRNLNRVIDVNFYPTEKTRYSNMLHRPIGIGVQGLADTFALMDIAFHSHAACEINRKIFETIYHGAMESSMEISKERGIFMKKIQTMVGSLSANNSGAIPYMTIYNDEISQEQWKKLNPQYEELRDLSGTFLGAYSSFKGSPLSQGKFQHDLWKVVPDSDLYDWNKLRKQVVKYGVRNSLLVAPMPTASTSQILGNNECFEPITSNIYTRRTLAGEFIVINKHLMKELIDLGLWNVELKNSIIENKGSIQHLEGLSEHIKNKYKTVWEIPMKHVINMAKDRGAFICQSQSLNLWMEEPNYSALTSMHFYSWQAGLKTGIYYLRRKAKHQAQQFTIDPSSKAADPSKAANASNADASKADPSKDDEECVMCSA